MKTTITLILFTLFINESYSQQSYKTIDINGVSREYYLYLPSSYDPVTESLPLVLMLHGIGGTALATSTYGMNILADTERFIPVYLQGKTNNFNQTSWNNGTGLENNAEDLAFISQLIDSINVDPTININLARVYMTGISMGSIMTYNACRYLSDRIAAAVCHIGTMSTEDLNNYNPQYPVPILHKHGTADGTVPYDSSPLPSLSLVPETIEQLKISNDWQGDSTVTTIADNSTDGITIDRIVYNCTTPLELWRMNNADHILLVQPTNDTSSITVTWGFMKQFSHPNPSTVTIQEINKPSPSIYPNPINDVFNLINYSDFETYTIYSLDGKQIRPSQKPLNTNDVSFLENGTYIIEFLRNDGAKSNVKISINK